MQIITRMLMRNDKPQTVTVPDGAKPVAFLNRGGDPTVFFVTKGASTMKEELTFMLAQASASVPDDAVYIGTAEFGGGSTIFHCFESTV
jgi:hypothetical protein